MTQPEATTETEIRAETPTGAAANSGRAGRVLRLLIKFCVNVVVPLGGYYVLRWFGVGVYASLLISTLFSAVTTAVPLIRNRRVDGLSLYMTTMLAASVVVSFLAGSPRFLMAKDAWLTGMGGVWFLGSLWTRRHGRAEMRELLVDGPVDRPRNWTAWVNQPLSERELARLKPSLERGRPFGDERWLARSVKMLDLQHTIRREGRPSKKEAE